MPTELEQACLSCTLPFDMCGDPKTVCAYVQITRERKQEQLDSRYGGDKLKQDIIDILAKLKEGVRQREYYADNQERKLAASNKRNAELRKPAVT